MTLKQIRDQIENDLSLWGHPDFPDLRMNRIINNAQIEVQLELLDLGVKKWEKRVAISTLSAGNISSVGGYTVTNYLIPSDLLETPDSLLVLDVLYTDNGDPAATMTRNAREVKLIQEFTDLIKNTFSTPTLNNPRYVRWAGNILIYPSSKTYTTSWTLTAASSYLTYRYRLTDLSNDSTESGLPVEYHLALLEKAKMKINEILGKIPDKQEAMNEYKQFLNSIIQKYSNTEVKESATLQ